VSGLAVIDPAALGLLDIAACGPPVASRNRRSWRLTRHADCMEALRSRSVDTVDVTEELRVLQRVRSLTLPGLAALMGGVLVARRSIFHRRGRSYLRAVQARPITPALMRERADGLLARVPHGEPCDLVPVFNQLPLMALTRYLGLGQETLDELDHLLRRIMVEWGGGPLKVSLPALDGQCEDAIGILRKAFAEAAPAEDSRLHEVRSLGLRDYELQEDEICGLLLFLIIASVETTAGFLANMAVLLQRVPGLMDLARERADLRPSIVEEALRIVSPVRRPGRRVATHAVEIGGEELPAGSALHIDIEAAHRDPVAYPDPWLFDPQRKGPVSLAFSAGAHACLGGRMSRQMAVEVLGALTDYDIAPATPSPPDWTEHPGFRIPKTLHSVLSPR